MIFVYLILYLSSVSASIWKKTIYTNPIFVLFYSDKNDESLRILKTWKQLPSDQNVDIDTYNCDNDLLHLCQYLNGIPSIQMGEPHAFETYTGKRNLKSLERFIKKMVPLCNVETGAFCSKEQKKHIEEWSKNKEKYTAVLHDSDKDIIIETHKFEYEERKIKKRYELLRKDFTSKIKEKKSEENFGLLKRFTWFHNKKNEL